MDLVLLKKAAEIKGTTPKAIERKIDKGRWIEGIHWHKDPDGRRWIDLDEVDKWVLQGEGLTSVVHRSA
jgi:hypothetical protein